MATGGCIPVAAVRTVVTSSISLIDDRREHKVEVRVAARDLLAQHVGVASETQSQEVDRAAGPG